MFESFWKFFEMDPLVQYTIPVKGLREGIHEYTFQVGKDFFRHFEQSPIKDGNLELDVQFDKRPDMYVLQFDFKGTVRTNCDRCLEEIDMPLVDSQQLLVKFSENEEPEEAEVIFIPRETQLLNVARYAYEFICLAMPLIKTYDCENDDNPACNQEMLKYLENKPAEPDEETNPVWDELKKLNSGKNK